MLLGIQAEVSLLPGLSKQLPQTSIHSESCQRTSTLHIYKQWYL